MKKLITILFALSFMTAALGLAQDTSAKDTMAKDSMSSGKASSISGKISDDGKTFTSDKDGKSLTISNPDAVKGHEGQHVTLKGKLAADGTEVDVVSVKMSGDKMKKDSGTSPQ